jgi:nucleotide-binding universal stress UspA family protein
MYENILVPLDGSELAEVALPYAEELARQLGSEITLVYISESVKDSQEDLDQSYLQKIVKSVKERAARYSNTPGNTPAIKVKSVVLSGHPAGKIVEYAETENIGLIVMSTHGRSGIQRWALGSVADKVMRAATKPVVLIRAQGSRSDIRAEGLLRKVVVPLDGSKEAEAVIPYIEELASKLKLGVILIQVLARGYETLEGYFPLTDRQIESDKAIATAYLNNLGAILNKKGITVITEERLSIEIRYGNAAEEIIKLADEKHVDIVAMTTHGRSGVGRRVIGSVAERILREGDTPLLLVRTPGAKVE